jgi:hypothetical protein
MKKSNIIFGILLFIILVLLYIVIFRKPDPVIEPFDDSEQVQEIERLEAEVDSLNVLVGQNNSERDTIVEYKDRVKTIYREKYIYINTANASQLDSIIRAGLD